VSIGDVGDVGARDSAGDGVPEISDGVAGGEEAGGADDGIDADCAGADDAPPHAVNAKTSMSAKIAQSIFFKRFPPEFTKNIL